MLDVLLIAATITVSDPDDSGHCWALGGCNGPSPSQMQGWNGLRPIASPGVGASDMPSVLGATNPAVAQDNISTTICVAGWTKAIRPPASYTNALKRKQLPPGTDLSAYEEDHLISLEIGGHPTDPRNLWPEPWTGTWNAHVKDKLENELHRQVCAHKMPLATAQHLIVSNWKAAYCQLFNNRAPCKE